MFQQKHTLRGHSPLNHLRPSMKRAAFEVALKEKKQLAEGTLAFIFEKPNGFHMRAGQHVRMTLIHPSETDSVGMSRFFSLANSPQEANLVIAMRMRDTAFKRVLARMPIGDKVRIEILLNSPHGSLTLHDDPSKPAVFLIGGIGIVPAFSMIKDATERKLPHKIFLFYSNRRPEDAPFLDELENVAKQNPSFKLIATMTKPEKSAKTWRGETGYIDHSMLERYVDDLTSPIYYIAGLTEMVNAMKIVLKDSGVNEENIRAEEFSGFIMHLNNAGTNQVWKRYLLLGAIALMIIVAVLMHATAAIALYKTGFGAFSLFTMGLILVIVLFKVFVLFKSKHLLGLKHGKEK